MYIFLNVICSVCLVLLYVCFRVSRFGMRKSVGELFPGKTIIPTLNIPYLPVVLCTALRPCRLSPGHVSIVCCWSCSAQLWTIMLVKLHGCSFGHSRRHSFAANFPDPVALTIFSPPFSQVPWALGEGMFCGGITRDWAFWLVLVLRSALLLLKREDSLVMDKDYTWMCIKRQIFRV